MVHRTGTGIVSIILSAFLAASFDKTRYRGHIFATDLASAIPILSHNITSNSKYFTQSPQPLTLDWEEEYLPDQVIEAGGFDVILMADVTYNTASFPSLLRALSSLVQLNPNHSPPPPIVILGYKECDPDERSLWDALEREVGTHPEKVGECEGWPESTPIESWIGQVKSPLGP